MINILFFINLCSKSKILYHTERGFLYGIFDFTLCPFQIDFLSPGIPILFVQASAVMFTGGA